MSQASFSIAYGGSGLEAGTMDVRDLAPALLAVGQLFDAANAALNGERATISVGVQATTQGSFEVALDVVQGVGSQLVNLFSGEEVTAALQLKELVLVGVAGTPGLIWLVKKLRGKRPKAIKKGDDDTLIITYGTETLEVSAKLLRLYGDMNVRDALQRLVKEPLDKNGIDVVSIREKGVAVESVSVDESAYFAKPDVAEEVLSRNKTTTAYSIVSLAFKEGNKWRLHDGSSPISALIADQEFLRKVGASQVSFSKGDILICEVEVTQARVETGIRTEHTVLRVVEHRPAFRQLDLPVESADRDG